MRVFTSITDPELITLIQKGAVGVLPTDTVYGLVCNAANPASVKRLYELKARINKPGTVIAGKVQQLIDLGLRARYLKAVEHFWPNSLSVIVPCDPELQYLDSGKGLAVRIPAHAIVHTLLLQTGALLTSSANQPGQPTATTLAEAQSYFGDSVDFYVDGGTIADHAPSTVVRVVDDVVEVLRVGAVKLDEYGRIITNDL